MANPGMIGVQPGLETIMVIVLAPALAIVDISLTWIRWYREAEQARINQSKIDFSDLENERENIY